MRELEAAGLRGCPPRSAARVRAAVRSGLNARGRIRVRGLLGIGKEVPVKVEVCSGSGEWVATHAEADAGRAAWLALELRHDRCVQVARRVAKHGLSNLLVVGGDAARLIPERLPRKLATHVYVNFPEPPAWHEANQDVSAAAPHLLTHRFLRSLSRLLAPGGSLIIVSDNQSYLTSLAKTVASQRLRGFFVVENRRTGDEEAESRGRGGGGEEEEEEKTSGGGKRDLCRLLTKGLPQPGPRSGLTASFGDSYFHRLWANGAKKQRRLHLHLTRPQ